MSAVLQQLGLVGVVLVLVVLVVVLYTLASPFRSARWVDDVAAVRDHLRHRRHARPVPAPRPLPGAPFPLYAETGLPRSIRWPFNWWRANLALAWSIRRCLPGVAGHLITAIIVWVAALTVPVCAVAVMAMFVALTVPAKVVMFLAATLVVAAGGDAPPRRHRNLAATPTTVRTSRQAAANLDDAAAGQALRLALIRHATETGRTTRRPRRRPSVGRIVATLLLVAAAVPLVRGVTTGLAGPRNNGDVTASIDQQPD